jgi:hypothetical protein
LKPGGKLFLTTPNFVFYGPAEESKEYYQRQPFGHHKHYTLQELKELFDAPSFRVRAHYFETHPLTLFRNRVFYPVARYDYAIQNSRKYPFARTVLKPFSSVAYACWEGIYPSFQRCHHAYERKRADSEKTGLTIMLDIERV